MTEQRYGDPLTAPFWAAAERHQLLIQRCTDCGAHQFYPRPFCLRCDRDAMTWVEAAGTGTLYSVTTFQMQFDPERPVPYRLALVDLDEGPRLMTNLVGGAAQIGDRVRLLWMSREGLPPLPLFEPVHSK